MKATSEAARQYQQALEHRRTARERFANILTMENELAYIDTQVNEAREKMLDAMVARIAAGWGGSAEPGSCA